MKFPFRFGVSSVFLAALCIWAGCSDGDDDLSPEAGVDATISSSDDASAHVEASTAGQGGAGGIRDVEAGSGGEAGGFAGSGGASGASDGGSGGSDSGSGGSDGGPGGDERQAEAAAGSGGEEPRDAGMDAEPIGGRGGSGGGPDASDGGSGGTPGAGSGGAGGDTGGTGGDAYDAGAEIGGTGGALGGSGGDADDAGAETGGTGGDVDDAGAEIGGAGGADAGAGEDGGQGSACSGKPGAPGLTERTVDVDGVTRTFLVHIPESLDPDTAAPLVFTFHGFMMSADIMREVTRFEALADEEGFIAVFPQGPILAPWNVGEGVCGAGAAVGGTADDFAFVEAMLDDIEDEQCIDRTQVFVSGFSMGGYFSNHIGCQRSDLVKAIAPHSGGTYPGDCPDGPMPVFLIHGTGDPLIDPGCGIGARDLWVERNGCSVEYDTVLIERGHCEWHRECPQDGQVVLCLLDEMCHGWAGYGDGSCLDLGGGDMYEDATRLIWEFFAEQ